MTLSRFPIIGGQFYPFSRAAFPDRLVSKGVLKVSVRVASGQVLNIWNVHLQDGGAEAIRLSQVRELLARVQAAEDGQIADVVGGDFNFTPESRLYRELSKALGHSAQEMSGKSAFVTWDGLSAKPGAGETLDHIFVRRRAAFQTARASPHIAFSAAQRTERLSDHFGIEADLTLSAAPSVAAAIKPGFDDGGVARVPPEERTYVAGTTRFGSAPTGMKDKLITPAVSLP